MAAVLVVSAVAERLFLWFSVYVTSTSSWRALTFNMGQTRERETMERENEKLKEMSVKHDINVIKDPRETYSRLILYLPITNY